MVELDDRCYELFEFIESSGYRPVPESAAAAGRALARLHDLVSRIEFEDASAASAATARLTRELKRLLLYGLLRPEEWPDLVADVEREPAPAARRVKREA